MNSAELQMLTDSDMINTYGTRQLALQRGEGVRLWDAEGKEYLDCFAGIAVCNLGHAHPAVTEAITAQAATLIHVSNLYYTEPQAKLAKRLSELCFAKRWFFSNGGADANEAAIKLARRFWSSQGTPKPRIITMLQSFHGRTMGALSATGQPKYHEGFEPMVGGFAHVPYNDIKALEAAITPDTGAIMLEAIQGEGGIRVPDDGYLQQVRTLCDDRNVLMLLDEVQTGVGRTGQMFAHQTFDVTPDIISLAKGLANGVPIGAIGASDKVAVGFSPGAHATTFGGNPLSCAAAVATVTEIARPEFLEHVRRASGYFLQELNTQLAAKSCVVDIRGRGLMIGVEFDRPVAPILREMLAQGIICGPAGPNVVRFVPPLIITPAQIDRALKALSESIKAVGW